MGTMTEQEIVNVVNASLIEEFELDAGEMIPEAHIYEDLGLDSLDAVDMVIVLEKAFKFKIREDQAIRSIRTLEDLYGFITDKKKELEG
jgi:acyl carrier protein